MAALRFADMRFRPTEFLDFTSLTLEEFQILIPAFEAAFQAHMIGWRLDGAPRTARRFAIYQSCPPMMGRSGVSSAPKTLLNRPQVTVARKRITRQRMFFWSMPR